jgi:hypothetical protein
MIVCLNSFENYQFLLNKINHRFLMTTKLFSGWKSLIKSNLDVQQTQIKL